MVEYQYGIMRSNLNEEIATAIMIGDGREDGDEAKISEEHIRSIWHDDELYTIHTDVDFAAAKAELQGSNTGASFGTNYIYAEAIITAALYSREQYKGHGTPDFYCTPHLLNIMLLARDMNGRRIYDSKSDLAAALNVGNIYTAEQFEGRTRTTKDVSPKTKKLLGILCRCKRKKGRSILMANQYINKVIYGGKTLIDLSGDTVSADKLLKGLTAHDKSGAVITGTCTFDVDSGDADVAVAEILEGKIAYARGAKVTGTMPNKGAVTGVIAAVADSFTIPLGYHDGSGSVAIKAEEQAKLVAANIREGVTILGVEGTMSGSENMKPQAKTVTPSTSTAQQVLPDEGYNCLSQVTVNKIPYTESDNAAGGKTVTIG